MLCENGVPAQAFEKGTNPFEVATISGYAEPQVWVDETNFQKAAELIQEYEETKRAHRTSVEGSGVIEVICEDCGKATPFPGSLKGTTQECPHCRAFVDVGEIPWDDAFGIPED